MNLLLHRPGRFLLVYWTVTLALAVALFATQSTNNAVAPRSRTVTLLTGQVIHLDFGNRPLPAQGIVELSPSGAMQAADIELGTDKIAFPEELAYRAHPYIDLRLFDVGYLEQQGFGDDGDRAVQVLVTFTNRAAALSAMHHGAVENGIHLTHVFEYTPMASGYVDKRGPFVPSAAKTSTFAARNPTNPNAVTKFDADGVTGIYLDDKVSLPAGDQGTSSEIQPALNDAIKLIGADVAHQRGITGKSVKIAVVDTGIDASHPDLAGRVVAAKNFSTDGDTLDYFGHGTHVASIAAGTGAASDGKYQGIAPDSLLINAKALSRFGSGTDSSIIQAMEWAADQGANVINMSLGGGPSDGSDTMSSTVNAISKAKGVLFAIAAGNSGPRNKVSTPAAADESIAVAAIDKAGNLAAFSSRGPRINNMALKPDISAPGVSITAARANYGSGDPYATFSGTSMATPMVAGSAALVWQLHPEWTREMVKDALLTSATPIGGACEVSAFDQGAGAVNLAAILDQKVSADPGTVSFGIVKGSASLPVTLRLLSDEPTTVTINASLCQAGNPDGKLEVTPSQMTLQPGSQATVQSLLVGATGFKKSGTYSGAITLYDRDQLVARLAVGLVVK